VILISIESIRLHDKKLFLSVVILLSLASKVTHVKLTTTTYPLAVVRVLSVFGLSTGNRVIIFTISVIATLLLITIVNLLIRICFTPVQLKL